MIKNYLKVAFRNLWRHKAYSAINICGLAIGMAASVLILLWVQNELSYDRFNKSADRIYRITVVASDQFKAAVNPAGMPAALQAAMPQIERTTRIHQEMMLLETGTRKFEEKQVFYADSNFLDMFSYPLLRGDRKTAMLRPDAVLLTAAMAKKYFGSEDVVGRTLRRDNKDLVTVTGVLADVPINSSLPFDAIMPMAAIRGTNDDIRNATWGNFDFYSFVELKRGVASTPANLTALDREMTRIFHQHIPSSAIKADFSLQPLTEIHLHSEGLQVDLPGHGNAQYVSIFLIVAIVILLVACINFMNLATARSARRAKEVGLRKVVGAGRRQLIGQFMGESFLLVAVAFVLAVGIVWLSLPGFDRLAGKDLRLQWADGDMWLGLAGIALVTGLLAGSYPALYLSGFEPVKVLKSSLRSVGGNLIFRNVLVVTQFVVSLVLLIGTAVVYEQLRFIQHRSPGFDKDNLVYMPMTGDLWGKQGAFRADLKANPLTSEYTIVGELPVNLPSGSVDIQWTGKDPNSQVVVPDMWVSESFADVFRVRMVAGRFFTPESRTDSNNVVINETMMRLMGRRLSNIIGETLRLGTTQAKVIGVVQDFNFKPIQQPIEPLCIRLNNYGGNVVVRVKAGTTEATINALATISKELNPAYTFTYDFLDQDIANLYKGERQMSGIFNLFAALAIFISCLGLYGLSAYLAQQRTREIGVRKVLGASVFHIVGLLGRGFTRLILLSVVIAVPLSIFAMNRYLGSYAYHVSVSWLVFPLAALVTLGMAWVTVGYESVKAATANPVGSLRSE